MAQNSETVRAFYQAMGRGDIPFVLGLFDSQIEWREADNFIYSDGNPFVGPQAILSGVFGRFAAEWDPFRATPEQIVEAGDTVIGLGRYTGTYKATGAGVNAQFVHVFTLRDGKVVKFQQYTDTAQFRDAVNRGATARA